MATADKTAHGPIFIALDRERFGKTFRRLRHERNWTLKKAAEKSGLAIMTVHAIEDGRSARLETLADLARAYRAQIGMRLTRP
jgi:transcriptional regulator with XRE-family HTH domain